ncbi:hypothetical protein B0A49_01520 [Cryomyces minteri]|uniref:Uncharacterized protein n=1 Tax=Cryomyces minteri TaxID=331657 RepID=A0A4V5NKI4_9PEZI|nr:hypothetical protein B0A49_01520 [Cryomyces minteri]
MTLYAVWTPIVPSKSLNRSSHSVAVVKAKAYIFGGELKPRTPLDSDIHVLDIQSFLLHPTIYLHAGCPAKGRIGTLHSLDLSSNKLSWEKLASAPEPGRGGTNLAVLPVAKPTLARFGGFAGHELAGLDLYDVATNTWSSSPHLPGANPPARSVAGFVGLARSKELSDSRAALALLFLGEQDPTPPEVGHDGAGRFHDDVWVLVQRHETDGGLALEWLGPLKRKEGSKGPTPRGWFGYAGYGPDGALMFGGLEDSNERAGDGWTLRIEEA